jgi:hypothetical protein
LILLDEFALIDANNRTGAGRFGDELGNCGFFPVPRPANQCGGGYNSDTKGGGSSVYNSDLSFEQIVINTSLTITYKGI